MTNNSSGVATVVLTLVVGLTGCDRAEPSLTAPSPVTTAAGTSPQPGSIQMMGTVSDTAFRALPGARVEVISGPHAGMSTTAGPRGEFAFAGIFDETTQFRATSEGHVSAVRTLQPYCERCQPNWWINFTLDVVDSPVTIAGTYTMTFVANSACSMLPDELRTRTFTATIPQPSSSAPTQSGFIAASASVLPGWNTVGAGVAGDHVAFWLESLVEQVAPNTFLSFTGLAEASIGKGDVSTFTLAFDGTIGYCVTTAANGSFEDCLEGRSSTRTGCDLDHRLILTRR